MSARFIGTPYWPDPGLRALEIALAILLGFCALVLRGSRWPSFPSLPRPARADPTAVAWTAVRLRKPNVPELVWVLLGGFAAAVIIGGAAAFPAGLFGAMGTYVWLYRQRAKAELRENRTKLTGIDLLACRFHDAATAVLAGADSQAAWSALAMDEATAPLAAAVIRADRTGAPAANTVGRAARQLREAAADALSAEVRTVGVRATAPLTLCFLPAFICLGVVPTALGLLPRLHG